MSSIGRELSGTFKDIVGDITGVLSTIAILGVLMITLPVLLQVNKLVTKLSGIQEPTTPATKTAQKVRFIVPKSS